MRFKNIYLEGPDCSGKTTMFNKLHKLTDFKYNIQDRSCMSMFVYSKIYSRPNTSFWFDKIYDDLKRLDTLYVVLLPSEESIIKRSLIMFPLFKVKWIIILLNEFLEENLKRRIFSKSFYYIF